MKASNFTKETITDIDVSENKHPEFRVGDAVEVGLFIKEGNKERVQNFAGDVIAFHRNGIATTFTVRRIGANGIGVEKIFPYYSPSISAVKVLKRGVVRRAKLFYVRDRVGKAARIKEKIVAKKKNKASSQKSA